MAGSDHAEFYSFRHCISFVLLCSLDALFENSLSILYVEIDPFIPRIEKDRILFTL
ncbi:hypothetical protein LEP1GSC036_0277 [Leptospira weilii str. 2006001853]|uniref:Uncharacterized protein n=2 Tax=Leptospira weilii TaxID=28184 RepID=A0A828Z706_9LEPT|nr:hypothetical protein LEP1GSC036_0277 [Leptospira weilii str. 2006001853]EMJ62383.1 hypothetical protein LEP1GSC051_3048 [Leptospira sp. P2653]EMM74118.1 hypothetical protein LEP1GSC038_0147 [Leptospira weilii str. 2006001855]EMN44085.1 hypothetical protein LEP1GSC086_0874 [Leptospira weilii str. LNT 1234]